MSQHPLPLAVVSEAPCLKYGGQAEECHGLLEFFAAPDVDEVWGSDPEGAEGCFLRQPILRNGEGSGRRRDER